MDVYDLIIIGAGPAGMTAGIYATRLNLKTLLITKSFGGQIYNKAVAIENWPGIKKVSATDLAKNMEDHLKSLDIEVKLGEVKKIEKEADFLVFTEKEKFRAVSIIITAGAKARSLNVLGEKEFLGKGVSYCSVCDGPMFKNKEVAVIGGGNAGFETAIFLANIASKIYILEFSEEAKAFGEIQDIAKASGKVEILTMARLKEIRGDKFVNSILFDQNGAEKTLSVQGVFIEAGYEPASSFIENLVELNEKGEIIADPSTCQTKTEGLYVAGDIGTNPFKQIVIAAGQGASAALSAYNFIKSKTKKA